MEQTKVKIKTSILRYILPGAGILFLALVALIYFRGQSAKHRAKESNPPPGEMVDLGTHRLHLQKFGNSGPAVILESGGGGLSIDWFGVTEPLSKFSRVIAYDRQGYGWSEISPDKPKSIDDIVGEKRRMLKKIGINEPVILVGHSFGGVIVLRHALKYPDEVAALILVDPSHPDMISRLDKKLGNEGFSEILSRNAKTFSVLRIIEWLGLMALDPEKIPNRGFPEKEYRQYQGIIGSTNYFSMLIEEFDIIMKEMHKSNLHLNGIHNIPVIVLTAPDRELMPESTKEENIRISVEMEIMHREISRLSSKGSMRIVQNSGHYIQIDSPDDVVQAVQDAVKAVKY